MHKYTYRKNQLQVAPLRPDRFYPFKNRGYRLFLPESVPSRLFAFRILRTLDSQRGALEREFVRRKSSASRLMLR